MTEQTSNSENRAHNIRQAIKWTVYTLLLINFGFYIHEDWSRALHTMDAGSTLLDWAGEFATSIDELGWFVLLFMFELETYVLEDEDMTGWVAHTIRGARICCYPMLAHTVYAYAVAVAGLQPTVPVDDVNNLCDLSARDVSYVYNLEYTQVNEETCGELSQASSFYWVADDPVVSDMAGLKLERKLAWVDLVEAVVWLLIVLAIETVVRLQAKGISGGVIIHTANRAQVVLYLVLIAFAIWWATLSHWLYFWDELVWIGGFAAIEMNVSQWREHLLRTDA
ncbi:MAG: hypothetical protein R3192_13730 [Woeseiaceae bacterium]|nr:hypothetical protein [Woeseiaceae bacterium]